jgi:hypothetical protein
MGRRRNLAPGRDLRAEFGSRALSRTLTLSLIRLLAFATLCVLGTSFLVH